MRRIIGTLMCAFCLLLVRETGFTGQAAAPRAGALAVTDGLGRTIRLAGPPKRIACLYAFSGHVVTMLGRGKDIVAVVRGLKKDRLLHRVLPEVKDLPVPAAGGIIHIESLLKTRPDIVFLKPETARIKSEIEKLERFHLPYFVADYASMAQQMQTIEMMGKVLGCHEKAVAYNRFYQNMLADVRHRTAAIPESGKIRLYHSINEPLRTDARGTLEADWTQACGVINVSVAAPLKTKSNKAFAGIEQVLMWDPEVILVNEAGVDRLILVDPKWAPIRAVRENKVFLIPVGISRWGHPGGLETPLAVMWAARTIYPDTFRELNMKALIHQFYRRFFDLELDEKDADRILSGQGMRKKH